MILNYTAILSILYNRVEDCLMLPDDQDSPPELCTENGLILSVTKYSKVPFYRTKNKISFDYLIGENNLPAEYYNSLLHFNLISNFPPVSTKFIV